MQRGYSLVSQQIRRLITSGVIVVNGPSMDLDERGRFKENTLESRVQPSSFEPTLGKDLFVLLGAEGGLFRPNTERTVRRTILELPADKRIYFDINNGFQLNRSDTALVHLNEQINLSKVGGSFDFVRSSPKSSTGRVFPITRLLFDNNNAYDELGIDQDSNGVKDMWLMIQPLPFNLKLKTGLTLNQIRFFNGDAKLTPEDIIAEHEKRPLIYFKNSDGKKGSPVQLTKGQVHDGLPVTLDLKSVSTQGIVGLRARRYPVAIDMSNKNEHPAESYFTPIVVSGDREVVVEADQHYLFSCREVLDVPPHLNLELVRHSRTGLEGRTHDAGFIDNGFTGDLVSELTSTERTGMRLTDGMPLSKLEVYRSLESPDKLYGDKGADSNYQGQSGPRPSKHLTSFNFKLAAGEINKMNKFVVVQDANLLRRYKKTSDAFEFVDADSFPQLFEDINSGFFKPRSECEFDEQVLQPIPYVIIFNEDGTSAFSYLRTKDQRHFGDRRLFGKHSIGIGGHLTKEDSPDYIRRGVEREVFKEEMLITGQHNEPKVVGTLFSKDLPVDRVHFGIIYAFRASGLISPKEESFAHAEMVPLDKLKVDMYVPTHGKDATTETWSRYLIPKLKEINSRIPPL